MRVLQERYAVAFLFCAGLAPLFSSNVSAEESCMLAPAKLPDAALSSFKDQPGHLIERHPSGGPALSAEVRRLAASDVDATPKLIELAKDAKPEHIVALGIGLAQAAAICTKTKPELAETIKKLVAESGNVALTAAFAAESSLFALAPEERSFKLRKLGMGEPPDLITLPSNDEVTTAATPPSNTEEQPDTAELLGIGQPGFLYPFTFGSQSDDTPRPRLLPLTFGGGGLVATSGDVVSPTRPPN